jgi:ribosomal 50S subunit-associated protein YjgA (DUF615 family)
MADDHDKPDALLDKLDGFLRSGRAHHRRNKPPVLTDALSDDLTQPIPTLTNAIGNSGDGDSSTDHEENIKQLVASRLVASVDQEIADLLEAFPDFRDKLALLHRSISFAMPQLVSLRWEDADEDAVAAADDAAVDAAEDSGSDPDQQT